MLQLDLSVLDAMNTKSQLTILTSRKKNLLMCKRFVLEDDGSMTKHAYGNAKKFNVEQIEWETIEDLSAILMELETQPSKCVIRGVLKDDLKELTNVRRIKKDKEGEVARLTDAPNRHMHIDVDKVSVPDGMKLTDVPEYIISMLPESFHDVSYHYQHSSSAGLVEGVVSLHLWFVMTAERSSSELKEWYSMLDDEHQILIDDAMFREVQVNYTAAPLMPEGKDPLQIRGVQRNGLVIKKNPTVNIVIPKKTKEFVARQKHIEDSWNRDEGVQGDPFNAFKKKLHVIRCSGRLHIPILQACSAYKWACDAKGVEEDIDVCLDAITKALEESVRDASDGIYMDEEYLIGQYESANAGGGYASGEYSFGACSGGGYSFGAC